MKLNLLKKGILILLIFALVGCGSQESTDVTNNETEGSSAGTELRVAIPAAPPFLDSHVSTAQQIADVGRPIFETLVTVDSNFNIKPLLAESWEQSEDGKTITFNLRKGILFHNGKEMIAEDIVASLERWFEVSVVGSADFADARIEAQDNYTVVLHLPSPISTALSTLAYGGGNFGSIMPKEIIDSAGADGIKEYVGTGPFKFEEWRQDQYIYLTKFGEYKPIEEEADGLAGKREALVEGIYFMLVPDSSTRVAGILTGEYDIALDMHYDMVEQLKAEDEVELRFDPYGLSSIFYNKSKGLFSDVRAREAVALAIDRDEILLAGFSSEENFVRYHGMMMEYQSGLWSSDAGKDEYDQQPDREKAKELLKEAGYNGEEIVMITSRDQDLLYNQTLALQQQLLDLGLKIKLEVYDWPTYLDKRSDQDGFHLLVGTTTPKLDPSQLGFLKSNFVGWTESSELDDILFKMKTAPTIEEAKQYYNDLQEWFYKFRPVSKVGDFSKVHATRSNVAGFDYLDGPIYWNVSNNK